MAVAIIFALQVVKSWREKVASVTLGKNIAVGRNPHTVLFVIARQSLDEVPCPRNDDPPPGGEFELLRLSNAILAQHVVEEEHVNNEELEGVVFRVHKHLEVLVGEECM